MARAPRIRRGQRGAAIVTAMLVVTLAAVVVSSLFWREHVAVRSVENRLALAQGRWIERAVLDWTKVILASDLRTSQADYVGEVWSTPVFDTRMDETVTAGAKIEGSSNALLAGQAFDAQARFNLRSLVGTDGLPSAVHVAAFRRLLAILGRPESIADLVLVRVAQSVVRIQEGRAVPPQRPPMTRLADLLDIPGVDPTTVGALMPHAVVLPAPTPVNVNTASPEVLAAMIEWLDLSAARRLVARRERGTFYRDLADKTLEADLGRALPPLGPFVLSVSSSYFLVNGVIRYDRVESQTETLLHRVNQQRVEVVWQLRN